MSKITLKKGQLYKMKQYRDDTEYAILCPSKNVTLKNNCYYDYIPVLFKIIGYGKRRKLYAYSYYKQEKDKLKKHGFIPSTSIYRFNYNTIKPLTMRDCTRINIIFRENNYAFNKKLGKLIKLR